MLDYYGWIMPLGDIDHPEAARNGNRIFVHKDDVREGEALKAGCVVAFYLFVDENGLGAEDCHLHADSTPLAGQQGLGLFAKKEGRAAGAELLGLLGTGSSPLATPELPNSIVAHRQAAPAAKRSLVVGHAGLRAEARAFVPSAKGETIATWSSGWSAMPTPGSTMRDMRGSAPFINTAQAVAAAQANAAARRGGRTQPPLAADPQVDQARVREASAYVVQRSSQKQGSTDEFVLDLESSVGWLFDDEDEDDDRCCNRKARGPIDGLSYAGPLGLWRCTPNKVASDEDDDMHWRTTLGLLEKNEEFDPVAAFCTRLGPVHVARSVAKSQRGDHEVVLDGDADGSSTSAGESSPRSDSDTSRRDSEGCQQLLPFANVARRSLPRGQCARV